MFGTEANENAPRNIGVLERAHRGTLVLDDVSEMPLETQSRIVKILHNAEFERIGGNNKVQVDTRVVATTSKDLSEEIESGRFREDLFHRLNVVPLGVPSLSNRRKTFQNSRRKLWNGPPFRKAASLVDYRVRR